MKRTYRLKQRADQQQETRERIVDAAMALHEEIGPAATTISALAERAGVQRLTVYRHFPSERHILQACSTKWMDRHPPPDPSRVGTAGEATHGRAVLRALYAYYRETQAMWRSLYRDRGEVAALEAPMSLFDDYLATVESAVLDDCGVRATKRLQATIAHAVHFWTWASLDGKGLAPPSAAALVAAWIQAAAGPVTDRR